MLYEIKHFFSERKKFGISITVSNLLLRFTMWAIGVKSYRVSYNKDVNQHGVLVDNENI